MRRAFTLADVVVVIAIVAICAALSYPVFAGIKKSANRSTCVSNLRQWGMAIATYREDAAGSESGTPSQMGLPLDLNPSLVSLADLRCHGNNPDGAGYYLNYPFPDMSAAAQRQWAAYTQLVGPAAIVVYDPNHQPSFPRSLRWENWTVLGLRLDGSVTVRTRKGFPLDLKWWHE